MNLEKAYIEEIYLIEKVDLPNQAIPVESKVILCQNIYRVIQRVPNNQVFAITGMQLNNKATYLMLLYPEDGEYPQEATIIFTLNKVKHSGKVKFCQPMNKKCLGYTTHCYIQSD